MRKLSLLLLPLSFGLLSASPVWADAPAKTPEKPNYQRNSPKVLAAFRPVVAAPRQFTVRVQCDGKDAALGTVVGPDGWVLTKASELKGRIVCRLRDGGQFDATVVGFHEPTDLALLKVDAHDLAAVTWSDSKIETPGNWVASPGTGEDPVAVGVVSVATRSPPASARRNPLQGGFLGIGLQPSKEGVRVGQVIPRSGAEKAGIKLNDTIIGIGSKSVSDPDTLMGLLARHKAGDVVTVKLKRGKESLVLKVTLGRRPPDRGDFQNQLGGRLSTVRLGFPTILQHDSVLKPSDCGGPLVDLDGKVVGINIARAGRTESYAIPSETIQPLMLDLFSGKLAPPADGPLARREAPPAERVAKLRLALQQAEAETAAAEKVTAARAALQQAEAAKAGAEKKVAEARAALDRALAAEKAVKTASGKAP
jgi:serine protease Do